MCTPATIDCFCPIPSDEQSGSGIGGEYAELLGAVGVRTIPELARRNPTILIARLNQANDELSLVRLVPSELRIAEWVRYARALERVTSH